MSKFVFTLAPLLKHRIHLEQDRQRDLAEVRAELTALEGELNALNKTAETATDELRSKHLVGRLDVGFLAAHRRYILSVQRKTMSIAQKMTQAQVRVEEARARLVDAARQRKALEKLREKQQERWRLDAERSEVSAADEIGMRLALLRYSDGGEVVE